MQVLIFLHQSQYKVLMYNFSMCLWFLLLGVWLVFVLAARAGMADEAFTAIISVAYLLSISFFIYVIRRS